MDPVFFHERFPPSNFTVSWGGSPAARIYAGLGKPPELVQAAQSNPVQEPRVRGTALDLIRPALEVPLTASSKLLDGPASASAAPDLRRALRRLARAGLRYAEAKRSAWTDQLKGVAEPAGATDRAVVEGLTAWATDGNPATAALRGAWVGADGKTRAGIVAVLLLVVVLAPVLVLLILLGLLVTALVLKSPATASASG